MAFNPNDVAVFNGNIFGFPFLQNPELTIIPVPWDATASFGKGTAQAPEKIVEASLQLDFYDPDYTGSWDNGITLLPLNKDINQKNTYFNQKSIPYIQKLESGKQLNEDDKLFLKEINAFSLKINNYVYQEAIKCFKNNKKAAVLGGEHSVPFGLIKAASEFFTDFGILQIDAHADLRKAYEGFEHSHASIFYNVLNQIEIKKLVQVGIRDISPNEVDFINKNPKVKTFFDWDIKAAQFSGLSWSQIIQPIVDSLPQNIHISFDIDGLDPKLCPNTGTPVLGGFEFEQINHLFRAMIASGRKIVSFDLCEVGNDDWDANVGARVLYKLCNFLLLN
ncbi:MAG: agmatinase family protein [Vicingaceae bacterium]